MAAAKTAGAVQAPPATTTAVTANPMNGETETQKRTRARVAVKEIDWGQAATAADLKSARAERTSVWSQLLDSLYKGTEEGKAPRVKNADGSEGELQFVPLGMFANVGGARTQVKAFEDKGLNQTYDFKTQVVGKTSTLWARVREVEA